MTFATHTTVTGVGISEGAVTGVRTDRGAAATSLLINAAGPWAAAVASLAGLEIPVVPVRHEYFVTRPVAGWHGGLPVLRIPDIRIYARAEGPGILCGGWEADGLSLDPRQVTVGQPLAVRPDWDGLPLRLCGLLVPMQEHPKRHYQDDRGSANGGHELYLR